MMVAKKAKTAKKGKKHLKQEPSTESDGKPEDLDTKPEEFGPESFPSKTVPQMIKERVVVAGLKMEEEWTFKHDEAVDEFINNPSEKTLFMYKDTFSGFCVKPTVPAYFTKQLCYFIRHRVEVLTSDNFVASVYYGSLTGGYIESLARLMSSIHTPRFFHFKEWPDIVKNEFSSQMHRFMAHLIDARYKQEDKTVLYIPVEDTAQKSTRAALFVPKEYMQKVEIAAANKEYVTRMEACVIHWTRQVKDILTTQSLLEIAENAGPLEELEHWKNRCADFCGIQKQIENRSVQFITDVLECANSDYVNIFKMKAAEIKMGSRQAESNYRFLMVLKEPCHQLADATPTEIPALLPKILQTVRMIWLHSEYYNSEELITTLMKRISSEVIRRCSETISIDRIFEGYVSQCRKALHNCVTCCTAWEEIYDKTATIHSKFSDYEWDLDKETIFSHVKGFVQRCKDMLEVCDAMEDFANFEDGTQRPVPMFGGRRGVDIQQSLKSVEMLFTHSVKSMAVNKKTIMKAKTAAWHEDFIKFNTMVKDLEIKVQNILNSIFETVTTPEQGIEVLDCFMHFENREPIKRTIEKKTADVYALLNAEMNSVRQEISVKGTLPMLQHPKFAGECHRIRALKRRIEKVMVHLDRAFFLPPVETIAEVKNTYRNLCHVCDEHIRRLFFEWLRVVDENASKLLECPVLCRSTEVKNRLDVNMKGPIMKLFRELDYWTRLSYDVPHFFTKLYERRNELLNLREQVLLVVRGYNRIMSALNSEEMGLFKEKVKHLDKRLHLGLTKIFWVSKDMLDVFFSEARQQTSKVQCMVDDYKAGNVYIMSLYVKISEQLLLKLQKDKLYEGLAFQDEQAKHREQAIGKITDVVDEILVHLARTYAMFQHEPEAVQNYWYWYIVKQDSILEEALRLNVKRSLKTLAKAIIGDNRSPPEPLFKIEVILEKNRIEFSPRLHDLKRIIRSIWIDCINMLTRFKRLPEVLNKRTVDKEPLFKSIGKCREAKKAQNSINSGMDANAKLLQSYLSVWDNFREIWEINKVGFLKHYQKLNPSVTSFDADIARYTEVANNIQMQEAIQSIQFVLLDCTPLKMALLAHCQEWHNKFTQLLLTMATTELLEITNYLVDNGTNITTPPTSLDEYAESIKLMDKLQAEKSSVRGRFDPLNDKFLILAKYNIPVEPSISEKHANLLNVWRQFEIQLVEAEIMLELKKEEFTKSLVGGSETFKKAATEALQEFAAKGPFSSNISPQEALSAIAQMRAHLNALKEEEARLRRGLAMFKIDLPVSKEIQQLEKELDAIEAVWMLAAEWEELWNQWKGGSFSDLKVADMEDIVNQVFKRISKYSKDLREKNWEIVDVTRSKVDQFRRTLPLITDLKNKAMRKRHWEEIMSLLETEFEPESNDFNLEYIIEHGFDKFGSMISEISSAATKELQVETALGNIANTWKNNEYDIVPYKERGHFKFRSTDNVFQSLEENQVALTTMKASRFVKPFAADVEYWEKTLSLITEITEMLLTVQRLWMYMETIFLGEDIRRQLPQETAEFDAINKKWKKITASVHKIKIVRIFCQKPGMMNDLNDMNKNLELIQKSLDMYLETKRQIFPRFYFISNDDLLEILGNTKNPENIQPHLKKLFDNIKSVKLTCEKTHWKGLGMTSTEGEYVLFEKPMSVEGPVESWLCEVESSMRWTLKDVLRNCRVALRKMLTRRDKWIKDWPGQVCITSSQIQWTSDVTRALIQVKESGERAPLKKQKKKQVKMLAKFSEAIRGNLNKNQRAKIVALVTIEVHARDIIEKLYKSGCKDVNAFDWLSQLRLYWDKDLDDCVARQTNTQFQYGYEYLGNSGRLVITPLTDRCYMTLTTALHLHRGGSPKGPAGTGKTETTKDLGKALGMYVIVINCSDGLDYKSMGRMFSGLSQTGAWGCFDEFNRINIEVLSVVAQQILCILSALAANQDRFVFEGYEINIVWSCGLFITMNPGYAGRTELPDNLKSMFRPIAMVVPDCNLICEILLFAEGFDNTKVLAKKVFTLYSLAVQQLSRQDHYDFALRAIVSLLRYSGKKKRANQQMSDEEVIVLSMKDMNVPKLTSADLPLFNAIMSDLFPGVETAVVDYVVLRQALEKELRSQKLQVTSYALTKIIQLYETKMSRHSVMTVGSTQAAKSVSWRVLQAAMTNLCLAGDTNFQIVKDFPLNPKALSLAELYGEFDLSTHEWTDGVLSSVMRNTCSDEKPDEKWIVFDGPVDTLWIESMNSVMDDNKILTLINGERISMPDQVSLLFEIEDLAVASPATVSRAGMVYAHYRDMGWKPYMESWLETKEKILVDELRNAFKKWLIPILKFRTENCKELIPIAELNGVSSLCKLFDALGTPANGVDPLDTEAFPRLLEMCFIFCMIWSICGSVDETGRKRIDNFVRELEGGVPNKDTIYEYFVDTKMKAWVHWEEKLKGGWKYNSAVPFFQQIVPTVDTVRYQFLMNTLVTMRCPTLLVGPVGTGKTSVAESALRCVDASVFNLLTVNMSAQTSSNQVQDIIESRLEKRTKGVYVPVGSKKLITFMDDFNMPAKDTFGSQPPLELIRLWIDYGFWYDRLNQTTKKILDMLLIAAMGPPGGGRMTISCRLLSRFNLINMTFPQESQIRRIFGSMIEQKLEDFEELVKPIGAVMTEATIELYNIIVQRFLPTPAKIHYLFNLRDISRVFQGLLRADTKYHYTKDALTRLWIHECFRVFSDRLINAKDREMFISLLTEKLGLLFDQSYHSVCPNRIPPVFGDYINQDQIYEDITDANKLKSYMTHFLDEYNNTPGVVAMDLVLFRDAIEHVSKVVRVIRQPRGNMLLVGIGGSGRQSLTRLAAFICEYKVFQVEVTKNYRKQEFRDDLKQLYSQCGVENRPTVFVFNDIQVVEESFLEDINNILSSGEVPNLYRADEFEEVKNALAEDAKRAGVEDNTQAIFAFLINRVRSNLHVVLCMSPVGEDFRNRIRMYPAFVNCTTIDWFHEWPLDALLEVADKYLTNMSFGVADEKTLKSSLAQIFGTVHSSVSMFSLRMLNEMHRHNYVTPTNYLELVSGYKRLFQDKMKVLGDEANKLKNGLFKIDDTREKVQNMSVELEEAKVKVMEFQKECDDFIRLLVAQKQEADEQQKAVSVQSARIREEGKKCQEIADSAQRDLDQALPALQAAVEALEALNKKDMTEIKSYGKPPAAVETVMQAVMILRNSDPSWAEAKKQLGESNFLKELMNFDKDNITDKVLKRIGKYCDQSDFVPDVVGRVSTAAKSLCMWVRAMEEYGRIYRVVEPKRVRLQKAMALLKEKQDMLAEAMAKLKELEEKLEQLKKEYDEKLLQKAELQRKAAHMALMLERASRLVEGLAGERQRWTETVKDLEEQMSYLPGDCMIAAAFLSYMGPFLSEYREEIVNKVWMAEIRSLEVPCTPSLSFTDFMVRPTVVRDWNTQGLPSDVFSTENGIIVTKGNRWPLMVDPQCQAIKWIKNMEGRKGLRVIDLQQPDYMRILERAIHMGLPVLLQNVQETLDPSLDPVLMKSLMKVGASYIIKLADKEVEYNFDFRFYITTRLSNPHYTPEISTKTAIVNFAVKQQGLEAQLLGVVVGRERPDLEEMKDCLVRGIAAGKKKLKDLENEILRLLNETKGSLLEDETLLNTLEVSKVTSHDVTEQLATAETTEVKIDAAREGYRDSATRSSILFFVLNDMGRIDPMYQFSLDAYIELFILSIEKSQRSQDLEERILYLNEYHTYAVYRYTCRALFERHKLLFSFHMCAKVLEDAGKINMDEYSFFLRGGVVLDRGNQMDNPCTWLSDVTWDNITELDKLINFHGITNSFEQYGKDWNDWYTSDNPETAPFPGEWENACNELQRMLIVRSLRPDRVSFCVTSFIINNMGSKFTEPPVLNMLHVLEDSSSKTPLIFVLSPGVDPTASLIQLAQSQGFGDRFTALSLGQGQAPIATRLLKEGVAAGKWVFLANCHLSLSWMPALDKLVDQLQVQQPHPDFRLWLSSSPTPDFPISILQQGIKITTEPPKGLKANMKRLYAKVPESLFQRCRSREKYMRLLFALCFFHSVLLERKKFLMLGWNIIYEFNDSDFEVSENLLSIYLDAYEETPWESLRYLIAAISYGGHVTDDWDRRLLMTYMTQYFTEKVLEAPYFPLSVLPTYFIPKDGPLSSYHEYINLLPQADHPEAFGQHPNADITSQIQEAKRLFDTLLSLAPQQTSGGGGESREDKVLELATNIYKCIPENIDYDATAKLLSVDPCPLNVVLLQEIQRYNALLTDIRNSLTDLEKGIQGLVVMTMDLEIVFNCLFDGRVPPSWEKAYSSLKPLAAWTRDLSMRMEQLSKWATTSHQPIIFWMSGFTFPTGFLTAVLQTYARRNNVSVDLLSWEFNVLTVDDSNVTGQPKEGVFVKGMYLQGAGWDMKNQMLIEAAPMQLVCPIPSIHFKPTEAKKKSSKGLYTAPCYYTPNRAGGSGRASFVVAVDLRTGEKPPEHWIKRGTALLLSLDY